jgi:hypothetical protein
MVTANDLAIWVIVAVGLAKLIKNVVYEPLVLGGADLAHWRCEGVIRTIQPRPQPRRHKPGLTRWTRLLQLQS